MRPLTIHDELGTLVLYTGRADAVLICDEDSVRAGHILAEHHPGTVTAVDSRDGVCVSFLGLESEAVCSARFLPDHDGVIPGLVAVTLAEWSAARAVGWWSAVAG